jgi:hypothetical protein
VRSTSRRRTEAGILLALLGALSTGVRGADAAGEASTERALTFTRAGRLAVTLDQDVYEFARPDLGDLRVRDHEGREVPYLLQRVDDAAQARAPAYPTLSNRTSVTGESVSATLDFGATTLKDELVLSLSGDDFRRRVRVEGRGRRHPTWETLTDQAYVFAVPDPGGARYEIVRLPENNHQFLRVTVFHGPADPPRIEIVDAFSRPERRRRPREAPHSVRPVRAEDPASRQTRFTLDLGARHQPFLGLQVEVRDRQFFRGVVVDAGVAAGAPGGDPPGGALAWQYLADGALFREDGLGGGVSESLRVDVKGRARVLRLTVKNREQPPLDVTGVSVLVPVERVAFEALPGRGYRLTYGVPELGPPTYELVRTAGDPALWSARAEEARLGDPVRRPLADAASWTQQYAGWLWGGLLSAALVLAAAISARRATR